VRAWQKSSLFNSGHRGCPRRLLNDGWWLETKPARSSVIAFPARSPPAPEPGSHPKRRHLTLVISEK
jgi:hypothetical protein